MKITVKESYNVAELFPSGFHGNRLPEEILVAASAFDTSLKLGIFGTSRTSMPGTLFNPFRELSAGYRRIACKPLYINL